MAKEQIIVNQVIQYLTLRGCFVWRQNTGGMYDKKNRFVKFGFKGISDIIGITESGKFIAVECKVKPNKPTQFQEDFLESVRIRGGIAIVAYDLQDVIDYFE